MRLHLQIRQSRRKEVMSETFYPELKIIFSLVFTRKVILLSAKHSHTYVLT